METPNLIKPNEIISGLMDKINETCNALISALEINTQYIGGYTGGIAHKISTEYIDILIKNILKIKYHLFRLEKELNNGLITSKEELKDIVGGLLETLDTIDSICTTDGYLRNQFSFVIEELKTMIVKMLDDINISITA